MSKWRYRCPEGHASIEMGRNRFQCHSCRKKGNGSYDKSELVDLK